MSNLWPVRLSALCRRRQCRRSDYAAADGDSVQRFPAIRLMQHFEQIDRRHFVDLVDADGIEIEKMCIASAVAIVKFALI